MLFASAEIFPIFPDLGHIAVTCCDMSTYAICNKAAIVTDARALLLAISIDILTAGSHLEMSEIFYQMCFDIRVFGGAPPFMVID